MKSLKFQYYLHATIGSLLFSTTIQPLGQFFYYRKSKRIGKGRRSKPVPSPNMHWTKDFFNSTGDHSHDLVHRNSYVFRKSGGNVI